MLSKEISLVSHSNYRAQMIEVINIMYTRAVLPFTSAVLGPTPFDMRRFNSEMSRENEACMQVKVDAQIKNRAFQ